MHRVQRHHAGPQGLISRKISGMSAIYWNSFIRQFAKSLAGLFVPLYIYRFNDNLTDVVVFYLLAYAFVLVFLIPVTRFAARSGYRLSILYSNVFYALYYLCLILAASNFNYIYVAAFISFPIVALYWLPFHSLFIEEDNDSEIGKEVGTRLVFTKLGAIIAPLLGGLIIKFFGFNVLYAIGIFLMLASSLPLFAMKPHRRQTIKETKNLLKTFLSKRFSKYVIGYFGQTVEGNMFEVFWRIYLFLIVGSFEVYGALRSAVQIVSSLSLYIAGKAADKFGSRKLLKIGVGTNSALWFLRPFVKTSKFGMILEGVDAAQGGFYGVPIRSVIYERSEKSKRAPIEFFFEKELALSIGRVVFFLIVLILLSFSVPLTVLFILTGIANFLVLFFLKKSK